MDFIRRALARFVLLTGVLLAGVLLAYAALLRVAGMHASGDVNAFFFLFGVPVIAYGPLFVVSSILEDRDRRNGRPAFAEELAAIISRCGRGAKAA